MTTIAELLTDVESIGCDITAITRVLIGTPVLPLVGLITLTDGTLLSVPPPVVK